MDFRAMLASVLQHAEQFKEVLFILAGAICHVFSRWRNWERHGDSERPSFLDSVGIFLACGFAGALIHRGVLWWSGSIDAAAFGAGVGALMGLRFLTGIAPKILRTLYDQGHLPEQRDYQHRKERRRDRPDE